MKRMSVLTLGYSHFLMPLEQAVKAADLLADLEPVDTDYNNDVGYKLTNNERASKVTVRVLSLTEMAELELTRE